MKIGDAVSFAAGLDRHPEFGKLMRIVPHKDGLVAVIQFSHRVIMRSLKRVKTVARGRKDAAINAKRDAKRYGRLSHGKH